jgi:hypothetical protein
MQSVAISKYLFYIASNKPVQKVYLIAYLHAASTKTGINDWILLSNQVEIT